jgi:two-component system, NarL family, invasion response regulator UvrY
VAAEAGTMQELLRELGRRAYDVVILNIDMPGPGGLGGLQELRERYPRLGVLVVSDLQEEIMGVRVLRAGASGYLHKSSPPEELIRAIRRVESGGRYVSPRLADKLASSLARAGDLAPHEHLSAREFEVFRLIASGKSVSQVADVLCLSVKTVSTYRTRVLAKLGFATNADLTRYGMQHELVD